MKKWLAGIVVGSALVLGACGGNDDANNAPKEINGEDLAKSRCISCHGADLAGGSGAPAINKVGAEFSEEEILNIIQNGKGSMPGNIVQGEEAEAVAKYLSEQK